MDPEELKSVIIQDEEFKIKFIEILSPLIKDAIEEEFKFFVRDQRDKPMDTATYEKLVELIILELLEELSKSKTENESKLT